MKQKAKAVGRKLIRKTQAAVGDARSVAIGLGIPDRRKAPKKPSKDTVIRRAAKKPAAKKPAPKTTAPKNKIKPATVSTKPSPKRMSPPTAPKKRGTGQKIAKRITGGGTRDTGRHAPKPPTGSPKKPLAAKKMAKKKAPARKAAMRSTAPSKKAAMARRGY